MTLLIGGALCPVWAQGRYTPQGAAQRAYLNGEQLREAGDALRARKDDAGAQRKYAQAIDAFLAAKKADPAYIDVYVKLGLLYFTVGRSKDAITVLEAGLTREADNLDLQFWYGQNLIAAGQGKKGVAVLEALAARTQRFPEVHLVLGEHHYKTRNYAAAAPALERYLAVKPSATAARARLGNTWFKLKLFDKALAEFTTVRAAWPDNVSVQVNIGNSHYGLKQYAQAIVELKAALKRDPNRPSALFNLAQSEFSLKDYAAARTHYTAFVKQRPKNFNGRYFLGSTLMELGEDGPAIEQLSKAHALKPTIVNPVYKIGLLHLRKGRSEAAADALKKAHQIKPKDAWVISAQGTVARQRGDLRAALALHSEAAGLLPNEAKLQANLALTAATQGALPTASKAIDKALAAKSDDPWVKAAAARVLALIAQPLLDTDPARALTRLEQALALQPGDADLLAGRSLARAATGAKAGALSDAQAAMKARADDPRLKRILGRALLLNGQGAEAVKLLQPLHDAAPTARSAALLGAALIAAGQADAAITLLDSRREWRADPAVAANRALARFARVLRDLPGGGAQRRVAKDLRLVLKTEKQLPPLLAARARYAAAINALRRGDGKEGRKHLGAATTWARAARSKDPDARHLRKGTPGGHFDYLIAYADVLQKRFEAVRKRLEKKTGGLEKRLLRYVVGRVGASHFRQGRLKQAKAAFDAAAKLGSDPIIEHNQQVIAWQQKRRKAALRVWRALQGKVPEAVFNIGVAHEASGDQKAAWIAFKRYAETGRPHAEKAREIADVKQRIYRFEAAP